MNKAAVVLLCAACGGIAANLEGFRPIHKIWPEVATNWTDGRTITSALVANGKAYEFRVTGDPDRAVAEPFLDALKQWRFAMPADGTSPVRFTVTWEARSGRFVVRQTDAGQ